MGSPRLLLSLILVSHAILSMPTPSSACVLLCEREVNLRLYLHQIADGPGTNQIVTFDSPETSWFGTTAVNDWAVLDAPQPDATVVGSTKGMHVQTDLAGPSSGWFNYFTMVFHDGRFSGSSFQVMGINGDEGQLSIIGGTGEFAMARGVIKYKAISNPPPAQSIKELNIRAFYIPPSDSTTGAAIQ